MDRLLCTAQAGDSGKNYPEAPSELGEGRVIAVEYAEYVDKYRLNLRFSDGTERTVDFGNFLCSSLNPMIREYLDAEKFRKFTVEYGDLFWNDYDLCFPVPKPQLGNASETLIPGSISNCKLKY
jgi:hypothetical protein